MMSDSKKRKRVALSIMQKVELLRKLDQGTSVVALCKEFNVGKSTIYDLSKRKEIFEFFTDSDTPLAMKERTIICHAKSESHD